MMNVPTINTSQSHTIALPPLALVAGAPAQGERALVLVGEHSEEDTRQLDNRSRVILEAH